MFSISFGSFASTERRNEKRTHIEMNRLLRSEFRVANVNILKKAEKEMITNARSRTRDWFNWFWSQERLLVLCFLHFLAASFFVFLAVVAFASLGSPLVFFLFFSLLRSFFSLFLRFDRCFLFRCLKMGQRTVYVRCAPDELLFLFRSFYVFRSVSLLLFSIFKTSPSTMSSPSLSFSFTFIVTRKSIKKS